jgi:hypothetical protein
MTHSDAWNEMADSCYCDYDAPEFFHREIRRARKLHKCGECGGEIKPGEQYEHVRGKWDGDLTTIKTCERCVDIITWTKNNVPCLCYAYGNAIEDCQEAVNEASARAPEDTAGLRFGLLRRITVRDRLNAERRKARENGVSDLQERPAPG